jgi:hypothetical protein
MQDMHTPEAASSSRKTTTDTTMRREVDAIL